MSITSPMLSYPSRVWSRSSLPTNCRRWRGSRPSRSPPPRDGWPRRWKGSANPCPAAIRARLDAAIALAGCRAKVLAVQEALDPLCLIGVTINPESRVKASRARPRRNWRREAGGSSW